MMQGKWVSGLHLCGRDRPETLLSVKGGVLLADLKAFREVCACVARLPCYALV